jgi:hypothetical protein
VEYERARLGWEIKALADLALVAEDPTDLWYKRTGKRATPFTVEELGRIADALGAPPMWPFGDWDMIEALFGKKWPGNKPT